MGDETCVITRFEIKIINIQVMKNSIYYLNPFGMDQFSHARPFRKSMIESSP